MHYVTACTDVQPTPLYQPASYWHQMMASRSRDQAKPEVNQMLALPLPLDLPKGLKNKYPSRRPVLVDVHRDT